MKRLIIKIFLSLMAIALLMPVASAEDIVELPGGPLKKVPDWKTYERKLSVTCLGGFVEIENPPVVKIAGKNYKHFGYKMVQQSGAAAKPIKLGVVSTSKDTTDETKHNLKAFAEWFKSEKVEAIIMGGDIADQASKVKKMLEILAKTGLPVYVIMGNNDIRGEFNNGIKKLRKKYKNVINMNLVRMIDAKGYDIISLPGYYDPEYTASRNTCVYKAGDITAMSRLVKEANDPVIFLSHGPPKDKGKNGIDFATAGANVGDERMTKFILKNKIPFGIFGHIIEAGGKATALDGKKTIPPNKWVKRMYLNPGSSSGVYWGLNNGKNSVGMCAILEIQGNKARYTIKNINPDEHKKYLNKSDKDELEELKKLEP